MFPNVHLNLTAQCHFVFLSDDVLSSIIAEAVSAASPGKTVASEEMNNPEKAMRNVGNCATNEATREAANSCFLFLFFVFVKICFLDPRNDSGMLDEICKYLRRKVSDEQK